MVLTPPLIPGVSILKTGNHLLRVLLNCFSALGSSLVSILKTGNHLLRVKCPKSNIAFGMEFQSLKQVITHCEIEPPYYCFPRLPFQSLKQVITYCEIAHSCFCSKYCEVSILKTGNHLLRELNPQVFQAFLSKLPKLISFIIARVLAVSPIKNS